MARWNSLRSLAAVGCVGVWPALLLLCLFTIGLAAHTSAADLEAAVLPPSESIRAEFQLAAFYQKCVLPDGLQFAWPPELKTLPMKPS